MNETLSTTAKFAQIFLAIVAFFAVIKFGEAIFAPVALGLVVATMFLPFVRWVEKRGLPRGLSGLIVVALVSILIAILVLGLALPIADFIDRAPTIWKNFRLEVAGWKETLSSFQTVQKQFTTLFSDRSVSSVQVQDNNGVQTVLSIGPRIAAEFAMFFFFLMNALKLQYSIVALPIDRRLRVTLVHILRDVEMEISRYLLTISSINVAVGLVIWITMALIGVPNPYQWGLLATILNFLPLIGPAVMTAMLLLAGFASSHNTFFIVLPAILYITLHFFEAQILTSQVLGKTTKLNPFPVFLSFAFWIWLWGPPGGFVAIPAMLFVRSIMLHVFQEPKSRKRNSKSVPAAPPDQV